MVSKAKNLLKASLSILISIGLANCAGDITGADGMNGQDGLPGADGSITSIPQNKPGFRALSDGSGIVLEATVSTVKKVVIDDSILQSNSNLFANFEIIGPGGFDTSYAPQGLSILYVYAVQDASDTSKFNLILSKNAPVLGGPQNFLQWSYLGSFLKHDSRDLVPFVFHEGQYLSESSALNERISETGTPEETELNIPLNVLALDIGISFDLPIGEFNMFGFVTSTVQRAQSINLNLTNTGQALIISSSSNTEIFTRRNWLPMIKAKTVVPYMTSVSTNQFMHIDIFGWKENTSQYP